MKGIFDMQESRSQTPIVLKSRKAYLDHLVEISMEVHGNVVEIGVGAAKSSRYLCDSMQSRNVVRSYWGFDSFEGFPSPCKHDIESSIVGLKKGYRRKHWCQTPNEAIDVIQNYCEYPIDKINIVAGFYSEKVFSSYSGKPIALLHLDCDLYASYELSLAYFAPLVNIGGIIAFDEYMDPAAKKKWPGATIAINEWLAKNSCRGMLQSATWKTHEGNWLTKYFFSKISGFNNGD